MAGREDGSAAREWEADIEEGWDVGGGNETCGMGRGRVGDGAGQGGDRCWVVQTEAKSAAEPVVSQC